MRSISRDVGEKRFLAISLDELKSIIKPDVGAITCLSLWFSISPVSVIKVVVSPIVWALSNATTTMDEGVVKPLILRTNRIVVA